MKRSIFTRLLQKVLKGGDFGPFAEDSSCSSPWMPRGKLPTQWWRMWGAVFVFFHGRSFHFRGYEWIWYTTVLIIWIICIHFSFLPTQTHKSNAILWRDFQCLAGCLLTLSKVLLPNQQMFMNSPSETTIWQFAWESRISWCQEFLRWGWLVLRASNGPSPWCLHQRGAEKICWKQHFEELMKGE